MKVFYNKLTGDAIGTIDSDDDGVSMELEGVEIESITVPRDQIDSATDEYLVIDGELRKKSPEELAEKHRKREELKVLAKNYKDDRRTKIDKIKDKKLSDKEKIEILIDLLK